MKILIYFKTILKNKFFKNFLILFSGSAIGQLIILATIPLLTRVFSIEAFGVYALFSSSIILLKPLSSLNYELAIILPKRNKDAINILAFNLIFILLFNIILFLILFILNNKIVSLLNIQRISSFIYFIPLSVFFITSISALNYWNIRINKYKKVSIGVVSKSATLSFSQLVTGLSDFKSIGLIPGLLFGQLINLIIVFKLTIKDIIKLVKFISWKRMFFLASKYKDIPIFNTVSSFINTLSNEIPIFLITRFFGFGIAGVYSLAIKVSKAPPGVIGESISQVFYREASLIYNSNKDLFSFTKKTYKTLLKIALGIFTPLFIVSFYLDFIFGAKWVDVGVMVRIIIPWLFIAFLNSPISSIIDILNKQKTIFIFNILLLLARLISLLIGIYIFNDIYVSLVLFSITGVIFNIILSLYFFKISKNYINSKIKAYD